MGKGADSTETRHGKTVKSVETNAIENVFVDRTKKRYSHYLRCYFVTSRMRKNRTLMALLFRSPSRRRDFFSVVQAGHKLPNRKTDLVTNCSSQKNRLRCLNVRKG